MTGMSSTILGLKYRLLTAAFRTAGLNVCEGLFSDKLTADLVSLKGEKASIAGVYNFLLSKYMYFSSG